MIGFSISFCVPDIAAGRVKMSDVEKVYSGSPYSSWRKEKADILRNLGWYHWRQNHEACEKIARQLISNTKRAKQGKDPKGPIIEFSKATRLGTRKQNAEPKDLANWVNSESDINWL